MYDIKPFAKDEKELETLIQAVSLYSYNIGMEFGIENVSRWYWKAGNNIGRKE